MWTWCSFVRTRAASRCMILDLSQYKAVYFIFIFTTCHWSTTHTYSHQKSFFISRRYVFLHELFITTHCFFVQSGQKQYCVRSLCIPFSTFQDIMYVVPQLNAAVCLVTRVGNKPISVVLTRCATMISSVLLLN